MIRAGTRGAGLAGALCCALALGGCVETATEVKISGSVSGEYKIRRSDVSPRGAAVALASVDGAPQAVAARFAKAMQAEAASREITLADSKGAAYLVRGYLSAYPSEGGVTVAYVWDIFDAAKRRALRMSDALALKGPASADPWALLDDKALESVAARSADDIAAFLSNTPEAIAAAKAPEKALARAPARGKPKAALGYAPEE